MTAQLVAKSKATKLLLDIVKHGCKSLRCRTATFPNQARAVSTAFSSSRLDLKFETDGCALVTMKSGENRLHPELLDDWHSVLDEIEKNPECRVLVTTGQDKFFSNGLDLAYVETFTHHERQLAENLDKLCRVMARILVFPLCTVAAVNGHAFAGGAVLALAHDLRVMREDKGWLCLNEILVNVRFPAVLMSLLKHKISQGPAQTQAILFAKRFTAAEALNYGLVDKAVAQSQLVDTAKQLANQVLGKEGVSRENLNLFKKDLYQNVLKAQQIQT